MDSGDIDDDPGVDENGRRQVEDDGWVTVHPTNGQWCHAGPKNPINPAHYTDGGIEAFDYMKAKLSNEEIVGHCKGQVLKYVSRLGKKGPPAEDAKKLLWYATRLAEILEEK